MGSGPRPPERLGMAPRKRRRSRRQRHRLRTRPDRADGAWQAGPVGVAALPPPRCVRLDRRRLPHAPVQPEIREWCPPLFRRGEWLIRSPPGQPGAVARTRGAGPPGRCHVRQGRAVRGWCLVRCGRSVPAAPDDLATGPSRRGAQPRPDPRGPAGEVVLPFGPGRSRATAITRPTGRASGGHFCERRFDLGPRGALLGRAAPPRPAPAGPGARRRRRASGRSRSRPPR